MKALITGSVVALALSVTALAAQDSTLKSRTKVSGDGSHAVTMRGCLQQVAGSGDFVLLGGVTSAGSDLESRSTVKTDVNKDDTTVTGKSTTKIENDKHVATSGATSSYSVTARDGVDLAAHAGQQVEIAAVTIEPRKGGDKTADLKIKDQTKVERENAPDTKAQSKSKLEVPRGSSERMMAISVRSLGRSCD